MDYLKKSLPRLWQDFPEVRTRQVQERRWYETDHSPREGARPRIQDRWPLFKKMHYVSPCFPGTREETVVIAREPTMERGRLGSRGREGKRERHGGKPGKL